MRFWSTPSTHAPAVVRALAHQLPAGEVLAVQERDGLAEFHFREIRRGRQVGDALAGEFGLVDWL